MDQCFLLQSWLPQYDRSSVLLVTKRLIYTSSLGPAYYKTTDLRSLLQSRLLQNDRSTLLPSVLFLQHDRSTLPPSVMFITIQQIYNSSPSPVYYITTGLHFLLQSCSLQHDNSTLPPSVMFITVQQINNFSHPTVLFITSRQICISSFNLVYHNTTDLHFLLQSCLSPYDKSLPPPSVLLNTTIQ